MSASSVDENPQPETEELKDQETEESEISIEGSDNAVKEKIEIDNDETASFRDEESNLLCGSEILFSRSDTKKYNGWDNLRWMAYSGTRRLKYLEPVYRFIEKPKTFLAWASGEEYLERRLAVYQEPNIILVLRTPENLVEVKAILDIDEESIGDLSVYWIVESVVDPHTSKLRLSPLTTVTSVLKSVQDNEFRRRSCFELITPMHESSIILSAVRIRGGQASKTSFIDSGAFLETSSVEHCLKKSICDAFKKDSDAFTESDSSWKHQIILGTLHSYVILGNKSMLDEGIRNARKSQLQELQKLGGLQNEADVNYLDPRLVDALDESGKTPLHYACSSRFTAAVLCLVSAGANVNLKMDPHNETPLHLCAKKLDDKSLSAILCINRRPNMVDAFGRTPMYVAVTEGCTVGGKPDAESLNRCLTVLEAHDGNLGGLEGFRHPISYLALLMKNEILSVVLKHINHRYPLLVLPDNEDLPDVARIGISASAFYHYPVHTLLIGFRQKMKAAYEEKDSQQIWLFCAEADDKLVKTLETLLSAGFEPNERLEGLVDSFNGSEELANFVGFAPIQILAVAALDALQNEESLGETLFLGVVGLITNAMVHMLKKGARLNLEPPPMKRPRNAYSNDSNPDSSTGSENNSRDFSSVPRSDQLKLYSNKQLTHVLGGPDRQNAAQEIWNSIQPAQSPSGTFKFHTDKLVINDSQAPGGSDERSCAICWKVFGKLINRKHRCRISRRHICDECSTKRVFCSGEEHRVSDGQFLLAKADEVKAVMQRVSELQVSDMKEEGKRKCQTEGKSTAAIRLDNLESQEKANRDSLFGKMLGDVGKNFFGDDAEEEHDTAVQANNSLAGLTNQLSQTRDALNQRGEKLNTLAEKSDKLVNASENFANLAKELNRASSSWW